KTILFVHLVTTTLAHVISCHTFPSDAEIRRKWLVSPHTTVCSCHFQKEDISKGAVPMTLSSVVRAESRCRKI
uniref:THAP-type domain-containing protein n=1 Tax=Mastacembelus armatus TaxID=205130 RepID=A0A7N8XK75_9TELE